MKQKRAILEPLGELKHRLDADRNQARHILTHLRDLKGMPGREYFTAVQNRILESIEEDLTNLYTERMGDLWYRVNQLIEEA